VAVLITCLAGLEENVPILWNFLFLQWLAKLASPSCIAGKNFTSYVTECEERIRILELTLSQPHCSVSEERAAEISLE